MSFSLKRRMIPKVRQGQAWRTSTATAAVGLPVAGNPRSTWPEGGEPLPCILLFVRWTRYGYIPYRPEWCRELHPHSLGCSVPALALLIAIASQTT